MSEILVTSVLAGLLLTATVLVYAMGARAWVKTETQVDLLQKIQLTLARFTEDGQASRASAVSVDPVAQVVSFPRATDLLTGQAIFDPGQGRLIWQGYTVYYYDSVARAVFRRDVPLITPTLDPVPLESFEGQPLGYYKVGGRELTNHIVAFEPEDRGGVVRLRVAGEQARPGSTALEKVGLEASVKPRN